ncbi:hypothetical protein [Fictibacillus halophilus]|uniref:hypothetical protein n=1 Tax=Fictibacillus halophilus TaxID=1610490 RepID=UPI001CF9DFF4|nr:hypothetical protein [Fictibacillus halophilus]
MILSIFILLNLMVFIFFFIFGKKELHILEVTAYFFFAGIPVQNLSALLCLDLEWITISSSQSLEWAEVINRFFNSFIEVRSKKNMNGIAMKSRHAFKANDHQNFQ